MGQMASPERHASETYESGALASWHHTKVDGIAATDESLIQRINSRDETALAILYERHAALVYAAVRPILPDESATEEIIPQVFYRVWLKASDFKSSVSTVPEFLTVTARKCAFSQFLCHGFERGGLILADRNVPAFNVDLMTRVRRIVGALSRSEQAPVETGTIEEENRALPDQHAEQSIDAVKARMRAALKALRDLPVWAHEVVDSQKQEKS